MNVELIYDSHCPNVNVARSLLIKAFTRTGVSARWTEWERAASVSPAYTRFYGSPTILVDGEDIAGGAAVSGTGACRIYADDHGVLSRAPPLEAICSALLRASPAKPVKTRWQIVAASFPAIGVAALPKLACPLCFPAYAALLSAMGLEFVDYTPYLLPLTAVFLAVVLGVLALQARSSGKSGALLLGMTATIIVASGKFYFESGWLTAGGIILLLIAIVISSRSRSAATVSCPACVSGGNGQRIETP